MEEKDWLRDWIRAARKHAGMSQEALGDALSLTKGNLSAWENGRHSPALHQLGQISKITNFPFPQELLNLSAGTLTPEVAASIVSPSLYATKVAAAYEKCTADQKDAVLALLRAFEVWE